MKIPNPPNIDEIWQVQDRLRSIKRGEVVHHTILSQLEHACNLLTAYREMALQVAELQRLWHDPTPSNFEALKEKALNFYNYVSDDAITIKVASLRAGSPHAEKVRNGRPHCVICGYCDEGLPDPIFHPEFYLERKSP